MTVLITLTIAGLDSGPFDLFSDADIYANPIATNISKATLLSGYSAVVQDTTTVIKIQSKGGCINFVDIATQYSTTTSTTTSGPTTYTLSAGQGDFIDACNATVFTNIVHSLDNPLVIGSLVYDIFNAPFAGGGQWFGIQGEDYVVEIGAGDVTGTAGPCTV